MKLKQFFDISTGFRFKKMQWGSVPSIPVAVLAYIYGFYFSVNMNIEYLTKDHRLFKKTINTEI